MKKLIAGLFTAILMTTGLAAFTSSSANAACPYTGCVDTTTSVKIVDKTVERGERAVLKTNTTVGRPGATPKGTIKVIFKRQGGGFYSRINKSATTKQVSSPKLFKVGKYTAVVKYIPRPGSAFQRSSKIVTFSVVR